MVDAEALRASASNPCVRVRVSPSAHKVAILKQVMSNLKFHFPEFLSKKIIWILTFVFGTPAVIVWSVVVLLQASNPTPATAKQTQILSISSSVLSTTEDRNLPEVSSEIQTGDARPIIIKQYLQKYDSELEPYSQEIVNVSDKYELDFRLLVAIAQQESNLCKRIPENSHNCWGFGIYGDKVLRFSSYSEAFERVAATLKKDYIDKGLTTPEKIMAKYTPPSVELGGPWAKGVNIFLKDME